MYPDEQRRMGPTANSDERDGRFTAEEWHRLLALSERISRLPDYRELELDVCRLEFVRWLVRRGILNEG